MKEGADPNARLIGRMRNPSTSPGVARELRRRQRDAVAIYLSHEMPLEEIAVKLIIPLALAERLLAEICEGLGEQAT